MVEVAFQQGVRDYSGCELRQKWGPEKRKSFDLTDGITVRFTDLKLEGEDVRVESGRLEMSFNGEGFSRIPSAKLEVHDASAPGTALATLEYSRRKIEGMDPDTRFVSWRLPGSLKRASN